LVGNVAGGTRFGNIAGRVGGLLGGFGGLFGRAEGDDSLDEGALLDEDGFSLVADSDAAAFLDAELDAAEGTTDPSASQSSTTTAASTPAWAVALVVIGSIVGLALLVVQVQLILIFRKKAAAKGPQGLEFA